MAFASPPGASALSPGAAQNLRGALSAQAAPANPNTPNDRTDPHERVLLDLQRIRRALERAMEGADESDSIYRIHAAAHGLYMRLLSGVDPQLALQTALQGLVPPGMAPGPGSGTTAPGPTAGAPQPTAGGMPGAGGAPVSPLSSGQLS